MKELKADIKSKSFRPCYVLYGTEDYLKQAWAQRLIEAMVDPMAATMNLDRFAGNAPAGEIVAAAQTFPFLAERRVVLVTGSGLFDAGRKADTEALAAYLENPSPVCTLIFVENKVNAANRLLKAAKQAGLCVELKAPTERELVAWLQKKAAAAGRELDGDVARLVLETVGSDMTNLNNEMAKLCDYPGSGTAITAADVAAVCSQTLEAKIFDLVDALSQKQGEKAVELYRDMLLLKKRPIDILGMLIRQFRLLFQVKYLAQKGEGPSAIIARLGLTERQAFLVRKLLAQGKNFSLSTLSQALEDCLEADVAFKTGQIDEELAVELLILKYGAAKE